MHLDVFQEFHFHTHQILSLHVAHLLHDAPQPALELDQLVAALARLVVERRVRDQCTDVNVTDAVQQQPQILGGERVQGAAGQHIEDPLLDGLFGIYFWV